MAILNVFLLLLVAARCVSAQPSPPSFSDDHKDTYGTGNFSAATAFLIVAIVSSFLFLAFFSLYFRRCARDRSTAAVLPALAGAVTASSRRGALGRGLDPAVIDKFPTLPYSAARRLKAAGGGGVPAALECAVCLSEFSGDEETLRILPKCCHVFHPECIDTWLECHVTCPVCREDLSAVGPTDDVESEGVASGGGCDHDDREDVAIDVTRTGRSHSMGHVITVGPTADRFRLDLPEHVRREMVEEAGRLRRSATVAVLRSNGGERSLRRGYRQGTMSERWTSGILAIAEGSLRGGGGGGGMFNCLGGGGGSRGEITSTTQVLQRV